MTIVQECLNHPHQIPVTATLWGTNQPIVGLNTNDDTLVTTLTTYTVGASGCWSLDLVPNSEIEPAGTVYRIVRDDLCNQGREDYVTFISVPASGGPHLAWDLQTNPPGQVGPISIPGVETVRLWAQPVSQKGAICFIWDDGNDECMQVASINEARGQQVTFAITTDVIGTGGRLTAAQLRELEGRGHEIAAHGVQHVTGLPALTAAQRDTEYETCLDFFPTNGVARPSTWVYTFGSPTGRNDTTDQELWGRVDRLFDANGPIADYATIRKDRPQFLMGRYQLEAAGAQARGNGERMIRMAAQQPVVACFYLHELDGAGLTTAEYTAYCDLAVSLGVPCVRAKDAFPSQANMLVDGGFEQPNQMWGYAIGPNGSAITIETDTPVVGLDGTKSLKLHAVTTGGSFAYAYQHLPVKAGETYTLSGRYRTSSGVGGAAISTRGTSIDYKGGVIGSTVQTFLPENTVWTRFQHDYTAAATAQHMRFDLLNQPGATHDAWFDHVGLTPKTAGIYG